jgi:serine/threonine protein kinase
LERCIAACSLTGLSVRIKSLKPYKPIEPPLIATSAEAASAERSGGALRAAGHSACLNEDQALRYVAGEGSSPEGVQNHLDVCTICRVLVGEAARATGQAGGEVQKAPSSRPRTLAPGDVILNRYQIVRFVAQGGMGEVYEARDTILDEMVALKTLVATALDDEHAMNRLLAEVKIARQVTHPNVCRILEFGFHRLTENATSGESIPFLTMELLRGETLEQRIRSKGRLRPSDVARLTHKMIAGLRAIHAAGIVHRDLKPANVFVLPGESERVVLMDFGLARALDRARSIGSLSGSAVIGTLDYMAPEQVKGKRATSRVDIYALGLIIFEMLTGQRPFGGETSLASAVERVTRRARSPSELVDKLHPQWDAVVSRCLATDPAKRFATVDEISAAMASLESSWRSKVRAGASAWAAVLVGSAVAVGGLAVHDLVSRRSDVDARRRPVEVTPVANVAHGTDIRISSPRAVFERPDPVAPAPSHASVTPPIRIRSSTKTENPIKTSVPISVEPNGPNRADDPFRPPANRPRHPDDLFDPFENRR